MFGADDVPRPGREPGGPRAPGAAQPSQPPEARGDGPRTQRGVVLGHHPAAGAGEVAGGIEEAKDFCREFFQWYNTEHRHGGIGLLAPQQVHLGHAPAVIEHRQKVLAAAYAARPDRFVGGPPGAAELPVEVWINRALPVTAVDGAEPANGGKEGSLN